MNKKLCSSIQQRIQEYFGYKNIINNSLEKYTIELNTTTVYTSLQGM